MTKTKVAWIRDVGAPIGKPSTGRLNCACGKAPASMFNASQGDVRCACGQVYTWDGYIVPSRDGAADQFINGTETCTGSTLGDGSRRGSA